MEETIITIPEEYAIVRTDLPLAALAAVVVSLLTDADTAGLTPARYVTLWHASQEISIGFGTDPTMPHAIARWAERYGGTLTNHRYTSDDGEQRVRADARFVYQDVPVDLYGYAPAGTATT